MSKHPIPDAALDDRLAIVGTSGSGKTYAAGTAVERLLRMKSRVVIVDPLDVWFGLRLKQDGKREAFPVVIFGGVNGDLPLTEGAGALIGETVASMAESCIISLGGLGTKSAERRFMLAFLEKLYRRATGEPFHIVFDEADLWAPQKSSEPQLQNLMEQIVRRGRAKGFIPWLITQRPAVLSKDVLSQADALIAMKLTSSQDRDAIGGWIEGQADRADQKQMLARLPQLTRGHGIVWIPGRGILEEVAFPAKETFDSSRTPKRGETKRSASLKPIDLGAVKARLATVEEEVADSDPKRLKAKVADLTRQLQARAPAAAQPDPQQIKAAEQRSYAAGYAQARKETGRGIAGVVRLVREAFAKAEDVDKKLSTALSGLDTLANSEAGPMPEAAPTFTVHPTKHLLPSPPRPAVNGADTGGSVSAPQQRILDGLAWLESIGMPSGDRTALAFLADQSSTSSGYSNNLGALRTAGLIDYPRGGEVALTEAGRAIAVAPARPPSLAELHDSVKRKLPTPQARILELTIGAYPGSLGKVELAEAAGASPTSSGYSNNLGRLRSIGLIDYPASGRVAASPRLFPEGLS